MRLLAVDDDDELLQLVSRTLARDGHAVTSASTLAEARRWVHDEAFDLIVLDVMLGDGSGLDLCAEIRATGSATPILFLSARGSVSSRVDGLDAGGDDYLAKPFALRELVARVRALGRRGAAIRPEVLRLGAITLEFTRRRAMRGTSEIPLTAREWQVLDALARRRGRPAGYDELLESVWGDASEGARASLEVIVARLRRKLGDTAADGSVIRTLRGLGYALAEPSR